MTARAYVQDDIFNDGVAVHLVARQPGQPSQVLEFAEPVLHQQADGTAFGAPSLRLSDDMARALYEALARHYGGGPDMTTLRRDYDAERGRVDRLISYAIREPS